MMPMRPARICVCGRKVAAGYRCICQQERRAAYDKRRPNAAARGYDYEFQIAAKAYLAEPGHERCRCGAPATLVAHVVSIRKAPHRRMDRSNWRPSCHRCNMIDAAKDKRAAQ